MARSAWRSRRRGSRTRSRDSGAPGRDYLVADLPRAKCSVLLAFQKKTQNTQPRFARSQGPLARPTQIDSVRIHILSHL
jgi:hypothetical protein